MSYHYISPRLAGFHCHHKLSYIATTGETGHHKSSKLFHHNSSCIITTSLTCQSSFIQSSIQVEANLTLRSDSGIGASSTGEQISANHHQCYHLSTNFSFDSNRVDLMPANERDERLARALFADVQVLSDTKVPFPIEYNSSVLILLFTSISWKQVGHFHWMNHGASKRF